jgi:CelD/BcsL family acetyltransferase involved in cellulose biosynthesis
VQITVVRPEELRAADIAAWRAMQRSTPSLANPFLSPEFTVAVGRVRPNARVAVLTDGTSAAGFFPFERRRLGAGVPIAAGLTDCQGLIHAPGLHWDAQELLRACRISVWQFDHLTDSQSSFHQYQSALAPSPVIDLADGFESYYRKLRLGSPAFCSTLARKSRKLEREVGKVRFEVDSSDTSALRLLMGWKSAQYRRTGRLDRFSHRWIIRLIDSLSTIHGSDFGGVLSVLYAGDRPLAIHFGIRSDHVLAYWFPAYNPEFGKYSPGLISLLRMAEDSPALGVRLIDLGKGAQRYKETLKSADIFVAEGLVTDRSPLAAAHRARIASVQRAMRTVRENQRLFDAADRVLRYYGRARGALPEAVAPLGGRDTD